LLDEQENLGLHRKYSVKTLGKGNGGMSTTKKEGTTTKKLKSKLKRATKNAEK
jgi:hypothetical protein